MTILCLAEEVKDRRQEIETSLNLIELMETDIQTISFPQKDEINSFIDRIKKEVEQQIEEYRTNLLKQFEEKNQEKLNRLAQQSKQLERDLDCLENSVSFSRSFVRNASDDQIDSHSPLIIDQLDRLNSDQTFVCPPAVISHIEVIIEQENQTEEGGEEKQQHSIDILSILKQKIRITQKRSEHVFQAIKEANRLPFRIKSSPPRDYESMSTPDFIFGSEGRNPENLNWPMGIAIDPHTGNIVVANCTEPKINIFDQEGKFIKSFRYIEVIQPDTFHYAAVAIDRQSRIIVTDYNNHCLLFFDQEGNLIKSLGRIGSRDGEFNLLYGIAIDSHDRIIVGDYNNHRIQIFDEEGNHIKTFGRAGERLGEFNGNWGIAVDQFDRIIVGDYGNNRVHVFDQDGIPLFSIGSHDTLPGQFNYPYSFAVDHQNNIIVCDTHNNRIQVFDEEGHHIKSFGAGGPLPGQFSNPSGVVVDNQNRILICDSSNHRVQVF